MNDHADHERMLYRAASAARNLAYMGYHDLAAQVMEAAIEGWKRYHTDREATDA